VPRPVKPVWRYLPKGLTIIFEDRDILVVDKPAGLLTIGTDKEKERTAYYALTNYVRKGDAKSRKRLFIVHRLDREASGILVFAKTEEAKRVLQDNWDEANKKYLAIVHGAPEKPTDTIVSYLVESKALRVYSTPDKQKGKLSKTVYQVLKQTKHLSLLEVTLLTGRKHQIRVHLADSGFPIVGDRKYSKIKSSYRRLALHAWTLSFAHPYSGKPCEFRTEVPAYFRRLGNWREE